MNIYLLGYRGSGKTALGRAVAVKLKRSFLDTDDMIVEREGMRIPDIFEQYGEDYFRDCESRAIEGVAKKDNLVVATGGGIIMREKNREMISKSGFCIYLNADVDTIYKRINGDSNRPALTDKSEKEEIKTLLEKRCPLYTELAEFEIDTSKMNFTKSLDAILKKINEIEDK